MSSILETTGLVEGCSYWTFTEVFAENYRRLR